jgi:hypothetical protein
MRIQPQVYRIIAAPPSWHQRALAVVLSVKGSALYGRTAAGVHLLDGFGLTRDIEIVVPRYVAARPGVTQHKSTMMTEDEIVTVAGIPTTSLARTVIDLAGSVSAEALEPALVSVIRRGAPSIGRLRMETLRFPSNYRGKARLSCLLDRYTPGLPPESALEVEVLQLLRRAGYPEPLRQQSIDDEGRFIGRVDLVWPKRKLVLEVDSFRWHTAPSPWHRDLDRRNELTARGLTVMHATKRNVRYPAAFLRSFGKTWDSLDTS